MECNICANKSKFIVSCPQCEFECCRNCYQKWILSTPSDPHCMSCKKVHDYEFMLKSTTKSFVSKEYRDHRRNILLDREKALIPATMALVQRERLARENEKELQKMKKESERLAKEYRNTIRAIEDQKIQISRIRNGDIRIETKFKNPLKCPVDNCKGYIGENSFCSLCENHICTKCMEIKIEGHVCEQSKIDTVKLINKETKPCPNCSTRIQKIEGCSQIWCAECHTFFSWTTGKIITSGPLHNPDYFEWMRRTGQTLERQPGDHYCGGIRFLRVPYNHLNRQNIRNMATRYPLILRKINHMNDVTIRRVDDLRHDRLNEYDRISYLLNELSEDEFAKLIQTREKQNTYNIALRNIIQMIIHITTDKMNTYYNIVTNLGFSNDNINEFCERWEETETELSQMKSFVNECFKKLAKQYSRVPKILDDNFNLRI